MRPIQSDIDYRKLLIFVRLILKRHRNLVSELFKCRVKSYFVDTSCSIRFIKEVVQLLNKYNLSDHFIDWYHTRFFLPYNKWRQTVKKCIQSKENVYWTKFAILHESVSKNVSASAEIRFGTFWSVTSEYPDLISNEISNCDSWEKSPKLCFSQNNHIVFFIDLTKNIIIMIF